MKAKHVAVVFHKHGIPEASGRKHGDWSAFLGENKEETINRALQASQLWTAVSTTNAVYEVYYGTLTAKVDAPMQFNLTPLRVKEINPKRRAKKRAGRKSQKVQSTVNVHRTRKRVR